MLELLVVCLIMKKLFCYLFYWSVLLLLAACGQSSKEIAWLMEQAETVWEQQPDSALFYLNAIRNPAGLPQEQRHNYHLLRIQAKDKAGKDISEDTVICEAKDYFLREGNFEKAALAAFYEGHVFSAGNDRQRALQAFLEAGNIAEHITDAKRKGLIQHNIGGLYYATGTNYEEAIARLKKAAGYFQAENYYKYAIASLNLLGTCFLIREQPDSALRYQQQALHLAMANSDTATWTTALQNLSVTYREIGDKQQAKACALRATGLNKANGETVSALLNLSYIYYDYAQYDSAAFYANRILRIPEEEQTPYILASVYALLTKIEKAAANYQKALEHQEEYTKRIDEIYAEREAQSVAGIQDKYNLERIKNENHLLYIQQLWISIITVVVVLALVIGLFVLYCRNSRQEIKLLKIAQAHDKLHSSYMDFYKKTGLLKQSLKTLVRDEELFSKIYNKICQIFYNTKDVHTWEGLYPALNRQYNGLFDRLRQHFPQLGDTEFKICCLEYAGFQNKVIAGYVQLKLDTVQSKKSAIRKTLGIPPKGKIREFLIQELNNLTGDSGA